MPHHLSHRFIGQLGRAVQTLRQQTDQQRAQQCWAGPNPQRPVGNLRWMVLNADLGAATTTTVGGKTITVPTFEAGNANPAVWIASANSGYGGYEIDTGQSFTVAETIGGRTYLSGTWLLCRPVVAATLGTLWEPIQPFLYAYGAGYGAAQFFGPTTNFVTLSTGAPQNLAAGNGTTGNFEVTLAGAYLAVMSLSVAPGDTGVLAIPPNAEFWGSINQNNIPQVTVDGHFHCVTDPANTAVPWKIAQSYLNGVQTGATFTADLDLPALPTAYGNIATAAILDCAANDQIGLFVSSAYHIELLESSLVLACLGQAGA